MFLIALFLILRRGILKRSGVMVGIFFAGYGIARFFVEAFRQADAQFISPDNPLGHIIRFDEAGITMGQLLSLPMVALGLLIILVRWQKA